MIGDDGLVFGDTCKSYGYVVAEACFLGENELGASSSDDCSAKPPIIEKIISRKMILGAMGDDGIGFRRNL